MREIHHEMKMATFVRMEIDCCTDRIKDERLAFSISSFRGARIVGYPITKKRNWPNAHDNRHKSKRHVTKQLHKHRRLISLWQHNPTWSAMRAHTYLHILLPWFLPWWGRITVRRGNVGEQRRGRSRRNVSIHHSTGGYARRGRSLAGRFSLDFVRWHRRGLTNSWWFCCCDVGRCDCSGLVRLTSRITEEWMST